MEATFRQDGAMLDYTPTVALTGGEVLQLADGRAAVATHDIAASVKDAVATEGVFRVAKNITTVMLQGCDVFWDASANEAVFKKANDADFYIGFAVADASYTATTVDVQLNEKAYHTVDVMRDPCNSVLAGTPAASAFGYPVRLGGTHVLELTATNEAQKVDLMSVNGFDVDANAIVEMSFRILSDGSNATQDLNIGVANATHATDADAITESMFVHVDGGSANITLESDDGTTEVAATDSTIDYTEGTDLAKTVEVWFDLRNPADVQVYVNGANVLPSSVFDISAATGPLFLLAHLEKSAGTDTYKVALDKLRVRLARQ